MLRSHGANSVQESRDRAWASNAARIDVPAREIGKSGKKLRPRRPDRDTAAHLEDFHEVSRMECAARPHPASRGLLEPARSTACE